MDGATESGRTPEDGKRRGIRRARSWGGYVWFMSFGTFLPLPIFVGGYLVHLTFVGAPLAPAGVSLRDLPLHARAEAAGCRQARVAAPG